MIAKAIAEMSGTFAIVFVGAGSIGLSERYPQIFPAFGVPLAWALIIMLMIFLTRILQ